MKLVAVEHLIERSLLLVRETESLKQERCRLLAERESIVGESSRDLSCAAVRRIVENNIQK